MSDSQDDDRTPPALIAGYVLTALWAAVLAAYLLLGGASKWKSLLASPPNEFGDFLAGAFAPLAFLWLALTVWLQSRELRLQRKELQQNGEALRLQAEELRNSVEQLRKQTELRQADAQMREREKREQMFADGYERLSDTLLLALGFLSGIAITKKGHKTLRTHAKLRFAEGAEGLAKVLNDQERDLKNILKLTGHDFGAWSSEKDNFQLHATKFMVDFDSWLNGVQHEHFFDLEQRALSDGMVAMRNTIGEILQAMLPADDQIDDEAEQP